MSPPHFFLLCTLTLTLSLQLIACLAAKESDALLSFKKSLHNTGKLSSWDADKGEPCSGEKENWDGVICLNGHVWGLDLEDMGLGGVVDVDSLKELKYLRIFSLMRNNFTSTLPDFKRLPGLKALFLSNNGFAGEIPEDAFEEMGYLKKVHMANNKFNGSIPTSVAGLPKLLELRLEGNRFEGRIPDFQVMEHLRTLNVSHNALEGPIPKSLSKMDVSAFQGNKALCGAPLAPCNANPVTNPPITKKPSILSIAALSISVLAALVAIGAVLYILQQRKRTPTSVEDPPAHNASADKETDPGSTGGSNQLARKEEVHKLTFLRDDRERFDLQDLLKASAEVLGSGTLGSSYKAGLAMGPVMVVKRFKQLNNVGKGEFNEYMRRLGRIKHPNLLPTVGYLYKKEEKLLITPFVEMGSLADCLHGHETRQPSLDWPTRLKIVKGVAKGLQCLYTELPSLVTPHGHLKSSNVLLTESYEPLLSDYGLTPVVNQEIAHELMFAYKSPEYSHHARVTKKTDIWAFGVLVLEILTGRLPANRIRKGTSEAEMDLVAWVRYAMRGGEEMARNVIDKGMEATRSSEAEVVKLVKLLKLALECCEEAERRPDIREVAERVQQMAEEDLFILSYGEREGEVTS